MRLSPLRHNLARLRLFLGLGQKQMAKLAKCSTSAIQAVELCKLPLSEELARRISAETGIMIEWLLENDLTMPPIAETSEPFTIDHYNEQRSHREMGGPTVRGLFTQAILGKTDAMIYFAWMRGIFEGQDADIASWKVGKFLEELAAEYGYRREVFPMPIRLAELRQHKTRWKQAWIGVRLAQKYTQEYGREYSFASEKKLSQPRKKPRKRASRSRSQSRPRS